MLVSTIQSHQLVFKTYRCVSPGQTCAHGDLFVPCWWLSLVTVGVLVLWCLLQMQRALFCSFCHLSWSALAERWCLSHIFADLGGAAALRGLQSSCRATGRVSWSCDRALKASALPLGETDPFPFT